MFRRTPLFFTVVLLATGFCLFNPGSYFTLGLRDFGLPEVFAAPASTRDTTHLPAIRFITRGPVLKPETEEYLTKGIHFIYKFYITQLGYAFPENLTVVIRVFGDNRAYQAYTSHVTTSPISSHVGLYIYNTREIVVWKGTNTAFFKKIVFHEVSHLLLRSRSRHCTRWLSEGLSEYFEELDLSGGVPVVRPQHRKDNRTKRQLRAGKLPALTAFLAQTDGQWSHKDNVSALPRTLAWSLVYFLMDSEQGQCLLKELLAYYQNHPVAPARLVFLVNTLSGPGSLAPLGPEMVVKLEKKWHQWVVEQRAEHRVIRRFPCA
ncbi:MAG: DUF1570 domain-containing protein [Cytophagales bacterium]|nr:DUF1570 domain-containing protein [Cytophagales bacterium]